MTEIEGTSKIFAEFNMRHAEVLAKINELRLEMQENFPEFAFEDEEIYRNPLRNLIWVWDEQEKLIQDNFQNSIKINILPPEKSISTTESEMSYKGNNQKIVPKNWNHLSKKLKSKCIEFLDFSDRLRLRRASKSTRLLLDTLRIPIDEMLLFGNRNVLSLWKNGLCKLKIPLYKSDNRSKDALLRLLHHILEICDFQNLVVYDIPQEYAQFLRGASYPTIRVENFFSKSLEDPAILILKSCLDHVQVVEFDAFDSSDSKLQKVTSNRAPRMHFLNLNGDHHTCTIIVKNWLCFNLEIGAELLIQQIGEFDVENFFGRFRKHLVRQHGKWEREMRTSKPEKNLLIQLFPSTSIIKCTVVHPGAIGVIYA